MLPAGDMRSCCARTPSATAECGTARTVLDLAAAFPMTTMAVIGGRVDWFYEGKLDEAIDAAMLAKPAVGAA